MIEFKRLRALIANSVVHSKAPAVFLSGGIDSTIILHHLDEKVSEPIFTYTFGVRKDEDNEFGIAREIAEHYETIHKEIELTDPLELIRDYAFLLDRPRVNVWPSLLYEAADVDDRSNVYIGEGGDEHFGGYHYKARLTYQEYWGELLEWSLPVHRIFAEYYGLTLHTPLLTLPVTETLPYWDDGVHNKELLRRSYRGVLPDLVVNSMKKPGRTPWLLLWDDLEETVGVPKPETRAQAQKIVTRYAARLWVDALETRSDI